MTTRLEMALAKEIDRLERALARLAKDPPANLDEPDPDYVVIAKMRAIARRALRH